MKHDFRDLQTYFPELESFEHRAIFEDIENPWAVLTNIGPYLKKTIAARRKQLPELMPRGVQYLRRSMRLEENILNITGLVEIEQDCMIAGMDILLSAGVVLEPGAMIKAPAIIGPETEIRQGAYVRGNALVGERCTIGHTTEFKNSIFMNHSEAGHFAYVGDSVIGSYVNLGAGVKLANLQLRRAGAKRKEEFPPIYLKIDGEKINTGTAKIGAFMGDFSEAGCNCVTAPGVFFGAHSWAFANTTVMKGYYPPHTIVK